MNGYWMDKQGGGIACDIHQHLLGTVPDGSLEGLRRSGTLNCTLKIKNPK